MGGNHHAHRLENPIYPSIYRVITPVVRLVDKFPETTYGVAARVRLSATSDHERTSTMPHVLTMPGVADCEAGLIARWYKQPGDRVLRGEPLVELTFSSVARPKRQLKQTSTTHASIAHLIDPALSFRLIRTESELKITTTTAVARTIHMVVAADIKGVLRSIGGATGQPLQSGSIIAQFASEIA